MDLDLTGRHALVCGASQGIGAATAHELASLGATVTVLARNEQRLNAVMQALPVDAGQQHAVLVGDAAAPDTLQQRVRERAREHPVQILVNNSAGPAAGPIRTADASAFVAAFQQHLIANHLLVQTVLADMQAARWGRIVNVVSTSVYEPIPNLGVSNTTRAAVAGWAKTLAREVAPHGITVNNVLPGFTETGRIQALVAERAEREQADQDRIRADMIAAVPAGRFAQPEETAAAIAFLCSPAAAYITGVSLPVDGGRLHAI